MFTFRTITEPELPLIKAWESEPRIWNLFNNGDPIQHSEDFEKYKENELGGYYLAFVGNEPVGTLIVETTDNKTASIVYYLGNNKYIGKGYGSQFVKDILSFLLERGYEEIIANVNEINYPSWKSLREAGFKVGCFRDYPSKVATIEGKKEFRTIELRYSKAAEALEDRDLGDYLVSNKEYYISQLGQLTA